MSLSFNFYFYFVSFLGASFIAGSTLGHYALANWCLLIAAALQVSWIVVAAFDEHFIDYDKSASKALRRLATVYQMLLMCIPWVFLNKLHLMGRAKHQSYSSQKEIAVRYSWPLALTAILQIGPIWYNHSNLIKGTLPQNDSVYVWTDPATGYIFNLAQRVEELSALKTRFEQVPEHDQQTRFKLYESIGVDPTSVILALSIEVQYYARLKKTVKIVAKEQGKSKAEYSEARWQLSQSLIASAQWGNNLLKRTLELNAPQKMSLFYFPVGGALAQAFVIGIDQKMSANAYRKMSESMSKHESRTSVRKPAHQNSADLIIEAAKMHL